MQGILKTALAFLILFSGVISNTEPSNEVDQTPVESAGPPELQSFYKSCCTPLATDEL